MKRAPKKKFVRVTFSIAKEDVVVLDQMVEREHLDRSKFITRLIYKALDQDKEAA